MRLHPPRAFPAALAAACALTAALTGALTATPATATAGTPAVVAVHLTITVQSTSDWTQVSIGTAQVAAQKVTRSSGAGVWTALPTGVGLAGGTGATSTAVDEVVLADLSGATSFPLAVTKGYHGTTRVTIVDDDDPRAAAQTVTDAVHSLTDGTDRSTWTLTRATLFGSVPLALPRTDSRRLVLADYYPWWDSYGGPTFADVPADPRSTMTLAGVEAMTAQARAHGVDGFVVSWDGQAEHGRELALAVQAAQDEHQVVTGYVETGEARETLTPAATELTWIEQLLAYRSSPAFLTASDGVPVVFVYDMAALSATQWRAITAALAIRHLAVHLIGDATGSSYLPLEWGLGSYAATAPADQLTVTAVQQGLLAKAAAVVGAGAPRLSVGTVSPGYDDSRLRGSTNPVVPRGDGSRYDETWAAALTGQPDWVLVTSWNEWYEGTAIEPGAASGDEALVQTGQEATAWKGASG